MRRHSRINFDKIDGLVGRLEAYRRAYHPTPQEQAEDREDMRALRTVGIAWAIIGAVILGAVLLARAL